MPERTFSSPEYRYGFNGKEKDEEGEWGSLTHYDYGFRIYNPGVGRFLSVDPLTPDFPWWTPYQFAGNMPIWASDLDGLEPNFETGKYNVQPGQTLYGIEDDLGYKRGTLENLNPQIDDINYIQEGQDLNIATRDGNLLIYPDEANIEQSKLEHNGDRFVPGLGLVDEIFADEESAEILILTGELIQEALLLYGPNSRLPKPRASKVLIEKSVPLLRQAYERSVGALKPMGERLLKEGKSKEVVARTLHGLRRQIGQKFKDLTPPDLLEKIYTRNLTKYGDKMGPTIEYLRGVGKSWDEIIESAARSGGKDVKFK